MKSASRNQLFIGMILAWFVIYLIHVFIFPIYDPEAGLLPSQGNTLAKLEYIICPRKRIYKGTVNKKKKKCPKGAIVSVWPGGRAGNLISEYISMWAVAKKTGLEAYAPRCLLQPMLDIFTNLSIPSLSSVSHCRARWTSVVHYVSEWTDPSQSIILPIYILAPDIIYPYVNEARKELTFLNEIKMQSQEVLQNLTSDYERPPVFVAIHVRRTDYKEYLKKTLNVGLAPISFYFRAIDYFERKYDNTLFVIISDDPIWCETHLLPGRRNVRLASDKYSDSSVGKVDLAVMASCNHTIFDYGTYGFWGSILSGGETIVYNVSSAHASVKMANLLPNWMIMS